VFIQQAVATGGQKRLGQSVHGKTPKQGLSKNRLPKRQNGKVDPLEQILCQANIQWHAACFVNPNFERM
jgi:hypothetical protein